MLILYVSVIFLKHEPLEINAGGFHFRFAVFIDDTWCKPGGTFWSIFEKKINNMH